MGKSRKTKYDSQVSAETQLKYGPQEQALAALLSQAQDQRDTSIAASRSTARGLAQMLSEARPQVAAQTSDYLSALPQQSTGELGAIRSQLQREGAAAQQELLARGVDAQAGLAGGIRQAQSQYAKDADQIRTQALNLEGDAGTYGATRLAELLGEDRKTAHDTAQKRADRQAAADRASMQSATTLAAAGVKPDGSIIPGGKADPKVKAAKPVKWASPQKTGSFKDTVESLRGWIRAHKKGYPGRAQIAQDLLNGVPGTSVVDPKSGQLLKDPGVPKAKSQLALSVALDLEYDKHVSHSNIGELHKRRYKVSALGYPVPPKQAAPPATSMLTSGPGR